jgi:hypothetical protein
VLGWNSTEENSKTWLQRCTLGVYLGMDGRTDSHVLHGPDGSQGLYTTVGKAPEEKKKDVVVVVGCVAVVVVARVPSAPQAGKSVRSGSSAEEIVRSGTQARRIILAEDALARAG